MIFNCPVNIRYNKTNFQAMAQCFGRHKIIFCFKDKRKLLTQRKLNVGFFETCEHCLAEHVLRWTYFIKNCSKVDFSEARTDRFRRVNVQFQYSKPISIENRLEICYFNPKFSITTLSMSQIRISFL